MNTCDITTLLDSPSLGQSNESSEHNNAKKTEKKQKTSHKKNENEEESIDLDALDLGLSRRKRKFRK